MAGKVRDTHISRSAIKESVRLAVWARSAGRCTICNRRVLGDVRTFLHSVAAAELAHNVGATSSSASPRADAAVPDMDRESEENLLLVCHDCHRIIDHEEHVRFFPPEKLRELKQAHERRIEMATARGQLTRTAVIRVGSKIRGAYSIASQKEVAETLFALNYLGLVESQWSGDFTCSITGNTGGKGFWQAGEQQIDDTLSRVRQAIEQGDVEHISVFPFAPIPLLVYLGSRLDDKTTTRIFQKHRGQGAGWSWAEDGRAVEFATDLVESRRSDTEVVLVCEMSSPVNPENLPADIRELPRRVLRPVAQVPSPVLIDSEQSLTNFASAWRTLLAEVESAYPRATRWHVVASVPVSVAVELGRAFMRDAQPPVTVYERSDAGYMAVLDVNI
ncbi:SAVED domain-containing protein [Amycolatopsis pigmentata]|uniref:SAVED domain-containing protein n=1 Tax=Amycolatopsis pigmentata TaxID=450801 RepID=A0ABW5FM82_9PSEU